MELNSGFGGVEFRTAGSSRADCWSCKCEITNQGKDPTATIALMHVMEEEMIDLLERDNPRLVQVHVLRDQGYSGKEIGDLICRGTSSVYRDLDRIKEIQRVYRKKVRS